VTIGEDAMGFVPIPDGCEVVIKGHLGGGQACYNTLYYTQDSEWGESDLQDIADAVDAAWSTFVDTYLGTGYAYDRTDVRDMRTSIGYQATQDAGATGGGVTGGTAPNNVAIAVARRSGLTGRSSRGRVFVGGIPNSALVSNNEVSSTFGNAAVAIFEAIDGVVSGLGWAPVIVSKVQAGVPLSTAVVYGIVEWVLVNSVVDSMRRRLPGRGSI
jgi:hypothetical protein